MGFDKKTMGKPLFLRVTANYSPCDRKQGVFFAIVSPPWGVDLGAVGQWCDRCDSKKTTILG